MGAMRLADVDPTDPSVIHVQYTWLPVWIGMDVVMHRKMEEILRLKYRQATVTPALLDEMNDFIEESLVHMYPNVHGLREILRAIRAVQVGVAHG